MVLKEGTDLDSIAYFNEKFIPLREANINIMTHAFQYGTGVFEGIKGYWNASEKQMYLFKMKEHYIRLLNSCKLLRLEPTKSVDELCKITIELMQKNNPTCDMYIRPNIYKAGLVIGPVLLNNEGRKNPTALSIYTIPMGDYVDTAKGLHVCVSNWIRVDDNAIPARGKIQGSYVNTALAKTDALLNGFDDAIVLTQDGHVSEGSAMNLFIVRDGKLVTTPVNENILEGITRATVMELAKNEFNLDTEIRKIDRTELYVCDEVFFCGTAAQVSPITMVDHRSVGNGKIGPISKKLQDLYFEVVRGHKKEYRNWCASVFNK
ncbi:MAG: branched-chain amino acid transaminase [Candidatus Melainabacteria bacterium]|nr:branched-chain amino acid transaminase [Candidatus Melainabacteria bacterium]